MGMWGFITLVSLVLYVFIFYNENLNICILTKPPEVCVCKCLRSQHIYLLLLHCRH